MPGWQLTTTEFIIDAMSRLEEAFKDLAGSVRQLIALLEEAGEPFWSKTLTRSLKLLDEQQLRGATFVLGCFGGEETLSDFRLSASDEDLGAKNRAARLNHLRDQVFKQADLIASRSLW